MATGSFLSLFDVRWEEFEQAAPDLAGACHTRMEGKTILLGTVRRDGTPRISPIGFEFAFGDIWLGMTWQTRKALDLIRDPRVLLHNAVTSDQDGEVKLRGRVIEVTDVETRGRYRDLLRDKYNWAPDEPFHLFTMDIEHVAFLTFGKNGLEVQAWP